MENTTEAPRGTQTLLRGIEVLQAVANGSTELTGISEATGLNRSTAHRLIQGLIVADLLRVQESGGYRLGSRLLSLGAAASEQNTLAVLAHPVMVALAATVKDTVHLAVEHEGEILYLDKIDAARGAQMRSRVGGRMPLTQTGVGRALLLDADRQRWKEQFDLDHPSDTSPSERATFLKRMSAFASRGTAYDLEDNEPGIRCVAAPIRGVHGEIIGAISVTATAPYMPMERMKSLAAPVLRAAQQISSGMGHRLPSDNRDDTAG